MPTLLTAIMSHKHAARIRDAFREVKLCFSGAAPLLAETRRRFESLTGGVVMEGYSLTEAQMVVVANPALGEKKIGSVGMPLPDVDLRIVDVDGRRWLHTGDMGYVDADGYLFITDRKKELIKVSGYQVWPREVEEAIAARRAVLEAGVAPVTDPVRGEVPKGRGSSFARARARPSRNCAPSAASASRRTRSRHRYRSSPSCRRRRSARCCGGR